MIFTFTQTEATAVNSLLEMYLDENLGATIWRAPLGKTEITGTLADGRTVRIEHMALRAQGNVTAAVELTRAAYDDEKTHGQFADYYIIYGCCGALDGALIGEIFRVSSVSYMSLGSVRPVGGAVATALGTVTETVKLKNKWIVRTNRDQEPLGSIDLPTGARKAPGRLRLLDLPNASVLATDKVIEIPPADTAPEYSGSYPAGLVFDPAEWTYGQTLAHCQQSVRGNVLIDMETYGIASAMGALGLENSVLVLRVVTDALVNKATQAAGRQLGLLKRQLGALDEVLTTIIAATDDPG